MKRWIKSTIQLANIIDFQSLEIESIAVVDDAITYSPRSDYVYASESVDLSTLTRDQLLELPKRMRENIHDVNILRKLHKDELTFQQQREVTQSNMDKFQSNSKDVELMLDKLKNCASIYVLPSKKNTDFRKMVWDNGGVVRDDDIRAIINSLSYSDYKYSTLSYLDIDWNALLMVFSYEGEYSFRSRNDAETAVTVDSLNIYIKIDVDNETDKGYVAISFHISDNFE